LLKRGCKKGSLLTKSDRRNQDANVWKQAIRAITLSKTRTETLLKRGRKKGSLLTKSDRRTQDAKVWKQAIRALAV
jgi:ribosomal protein L19E